MQIFLLISLLIAIIAVFFALQNLATVTVSFLFWSINGSLALVLLVTLAAGVLISIMASLPGLLRSKWSTASQRKKLSTLEAERNTFRKRAEEAEKDLRVLEEQVASLSAELEKQQPGGPPQLYSASDQPPRLPPGTAGDG